MGFTDNEIQTESGRRYRWTDVSVLILSLLLAASVATVVYMAVGPPATTCSNASVSQPQTTGDKVDVEIEVDGEKIPEKIAYNEGRNVAFFYGEDGDFTAEDFDKGWVVTNIAKSGECVVIPTGNSQNRTSVNSIMSGYAKSGVIQGERRQTSTQAQILPGYIVDRSMFADEVNEMCNAYRWLTIVDLDSDDTFEIETRKKRQVKDCFCSVRIFLRPYIDSLFRIVIREYWVCLDWTCFDSDCTIFSSCVIDPTHPLAVLTGNTGNQTAATNSTSG